MLWLNFVPVGVFSVKDGIARVKVKLLFAGDKTECLVDIRHKLFGRCCLSGIIARCLNPAG